VIARSVKLYRFSELNHHQEGVVFVPSFQAHPKQVEDPELRTGVNHGWNPDEHGFETRSKRKDAKPSIQKAHHVCQRGDLQRAHEIGASF
jgi:hypothetical protein